MTAPELPTLPAPAAPPSTAPEIMRAEQLAAFLGVNRKTIYEYAARGVIPHRRLGRRIVFARVHVMAWLDDARRRGPGKAEGHDGSTRS